MASSYRATTKRYTSQRAEYVARMTSHSLAALDAAKQMILAQVIARAPSTHEEDKVMTSWEVISGKQVGAPADRSRIHFGKGDGKHLYIKQALEMFGDSLFEDFQTERRFGFYLRSIDVLDDKTHFYWVNEDPRGATYGPFESKFGTFSAFEYGMEYTIHPRVAPWLIPEDGIKIKGSSKDNFGMVEVARRVPAYGMFTSINRDEVVAFMQNFIAEQKG